ncbi:hypothetical protein SAMN02746093_02043 [Legionella quinlivanii DSM 21216]|nr:hypothetical protein SAMN02746093_02043 [Legionella quinlivanii DSM 21216]STY10425.1 Uncharacterised protein [Legionella quinlivanii]
MINESLRDLIYSPLTLTLSPTLRAVERGSDILSLTAMGEAPDLQLQATPNSPLSSYAPVTFPSSEVPGTIFPFPWQ